MNINHSGIFGIKTAGALLVLSMLLAPGNRIQADPTTDRVVTFGDVGQPIDALLHGPAPVPTGFLTIPWGADGATVKSVMAKRPGVVFVRENGDEILFAGGKCCGLDVHTWQFRMENNHFFQSNVTFEFPFTYNEKGTISDAVTEAIRRQIVQRYHILGENNSSSEHNCQTWTFPETPGNKGTKLIVLNYAWQAGFIGLTYTDLFYQDQLNPTGSAPDDL
jgi:hypothetical protein